MATVTAPAHQKGDFFVDYEEKVFEDVKADPGEKALVTFHTVAFEGSIGLVNILQALRLQRKGYETSILLYGPGVTLGVQRGFPKIGDEAFPARKTSIISSSALWTRVARSMPAASPCRRCTDTASPSLIEGIRPINPLDVLDLVLLHKKANAGHSRYLGRCNDHRSAPSSRCPVIRGVSAGDGCGNGTSASIEDC